MGVQYSDALTVPPEGAPEAPSNLRVQVTGAGTVRVSWVDNSDDEVGFEVYVQRQGQPFSERTLVEADEESVEVDGLESGYHFFWAYSYIGSNRSLRTSYVDVVVPGAEPAAPGDLDVLAIGSFAIVTWSDNSEDETGFEVQSLRGGELWYRDEVAANRRFGIVSGLEPGVRHVFRVSAYGNGGLSWSEDVVVVPEELEGPEPPSNLRATVTDGTSVRLTWTDNSNDEVGFDVQAIVWSWSGLFAVDADTESIEIPALARGGRYFFNVIAVDAEGRTAWSETLVVTLGVSGRGPRGPRRLRAMPVDPTSVRLTWEDDSTDELGFEIQVREFGERWRRVTLVDANEESALLTGLTPGSVEDYRVFAYNDTGFSGSSNSVTVKLPGGVPPTELTAAPTGDSAIELKWSGRWADTSLGLIVVEGRNPESEWVELTTTRAATGSVRINGLMTDTPYTFRLVSAVGDTRAFSGEVSATTGAFRDACRSGGRYLCLWGGRFEVQVHWSNRDMVGDHGVGTGVPIDFSDESGLFWFFARARRSRLGTPNASPTTPQPECRPTRAGPTARRPTTWNSCSRCSTARRSTATSGCSSAASRRWSTGSRWRTRRASSGAPTTTRPRRSAARATSRPSRVPGWPRSLRRRRGSGASPASTSGKGTWRGGPRSASGDPKRRPGIARRATSCCVCSTTASRSRSPSSIPTSSLRTMRRPPGWRLP